jgi:hypothetical protein
MIRYMPTFLYKLSNIPEPYPRINLEQQLESTFLSSLATCPPRTLKVYKYNLASDVSALESVQIEPSILKGNQVVS